MSTEDIVRAWKDAEYRQHLSTGEQARLPAHPAGAIDLADEDLRKAAGGNVSTLLITILCDFCTELHICATTITG